MISIIEGTMTRAGDVVIGCAESFHIGYLARIIKEFQKKYPGLRYHIKSGPA